MTRRDKCVKCGESVCGEEVCCPECGSYCDECVETYDPLSRIAKIIAYVNNNRVYNRNNNNKSLLTENEIQQFIQDLKSDELEKYLEKEYSISLSDDCMMKYNLEWMENFNTERNNIYELYESKSTDFYEHLIEFISNDIALDEPVKFICKDCFFKSEKVDYKVLYESIKIKNNELSEELNKYKIMYSKLKYSKV